MPHYKYLIIGGGMTADSAVRGIREVDKDGPIGLISAEVDPPYNRPPLSKGLWKKMKVKQIWRNTQAQGVELHLGRVVQPLDRGSKQVIDDQDTVYTYEQLLLATGGRPRRLPFGDDSINYFRTLADYQRLRADVEQKQRFVVIGGGFIGSEIAAALTMQGKEVVMLFPEVGIGGLVFPPDMAKALSDYYRDKGVEVLAGELVADLDEQGGKLLIKTKSGRTIEADSVVAGLGLEPNVELAKHAGLDVDNGIIVDEFLRTADHAVFAAGDVANFYNPTLNTRMRVEHEDGANTMGLHAGRGMAGELEPYNHLPFFYSDLFELGYEAVGKFDPQTMEVVSDWHEPYREGVVYYLHQGRVRGVMLWNVWGQVDAARALIAEPGPFSAADLKGRMPAG